MSACPLYVELCCGSAAVGLRLLGISRPPISFMGAKTSLAGVILAAMGLQPGQGADVPRDEANRMISAWHRHHKAVRSHFWAVAAFLSGIPAGVVVVAAPVAAALVNGRTFEVVRLATPEGAEPNVASRLLGSAWRSARSMGFTRGVSYTRADEPGTCYRAAGWHPTAVVKGREWAGTNKPGRWLPGIYEPTTEIIDRVRWEIGPESAPAMVLPGLRLVRGEP